MLWESPDVEGYALEDPHELDAVEALRDRVTLDAPIRREADLRPGVRWAYEA